MAFGEEFTRASNRLMGVIGRFGRTLSKRDVLMLQIGMRASHIEEALAQGDVSRANGHLMMLQSLVSQL